MLTTRTLGLAAALAVVACRGHAGAPADAPVDVVVTADAETLDPRYVTDATGLRITRLVHAGLMTLDRDTGAPTPMLAESAATSPDGLAVTFHLRRGVRFHSGAAFGARDVLATLAAIRDPRVASRHARVLSAIDRVEAPDDATVVVHLSRPHATTLTDLEVPILRADQAAAPPDPQGAFDGLGPFVVERRERGVITLAPAREGVTRAGRTVRIRALRDENARALRLMTADSDAVVNAISPPLLPSLEREGLEVVARPSLSVNYVVLRTDRGPFASRTARQALDRSIDRASITRHLLGGRATLATGMIAPSHWAHAPSSPVAFDIAGAREALGGERVKATLLCGTDRLRQDVARAIAQDAHEAGIDLEVRPLELGALLARLGAGDFDAATLQLPELVEPNTLRVFLHSTSIPPQGSNRGRVEDPELDALLDQGDATLDGAERRGIYAKVEARLREQAWVLPLWHEDQIAVVGPRARGFRPSAEGRWAGLAELR